MELLSQHRGLLIRQDLWKRLPGLVSTDLVHDIFSQNTPVQSAASAFLTRGKATLGVLSCMLSSVAYRAF